MFQKFQSPALGGFAVVSHWLPFLFFSVYSGALADRFDPRRLIQLGMVLLHGRVARLGLLLFLTDTLEMWHAMVLLVMHGFAGVLWGPASQLLIHDIVGPEQLQSAVRLTATARWLGLLMGPAVGGVLMLALGPALRHPRQRADLPAARAVAVEGALRPAVPHGERRRRARGARPRRHRADASATIAGNRTIVVDDAARRRRLAVRRQRATRRRCRSSRTTSGTATPTFPTACCSPPTPRARWSPGLVLESRGLLQRAAAHRVHARHAVVLRHRRLRAVAAAIRWRSRCCSSPGFLELVVQRHGADAGAAARARRTSAAA